MGFGDLGKKNILKRTEIEFSKSEPLSDVLRSHTITIDLIHDLSEIEEKLLLDKAFIKRVERELPENDALLKDIYFNFLKMTQGNIPSITTQRSFSALLFANDKFNKFLIEENETLCFTNKVTNLYVYGFYKNLSLTDEPLQSKEIFIDRLKVISQCSKYSAIPYMIDKKEKFIPFSAYEDSLRAYKTIISVECTDDDQISLLYWGLVFIALLNKKINPVMQDFFLTLPDENHKYTKKLFLRYVDAT